MYSLDMAVVQHSPSSSTRFSLNLVSTVAVVRGRRVEVVNLYTDSNGFGPTEVYVEAADCPGLMMFRGYVEGIAAALPRVWEIVQPLVARHLETRYVARQGGPLDPEEIEARRAETARTSRAA